MPGEPLPVMVTVKVFAVEEVQTRFEVPVPLAVKVTGVTVNGLHVNPAGTVSVKATVPAKLNVLVRVTIDVIDEPAEPLGDVALMVKSPTCTVDGVECEAVPGEPLPVIATE